MSDVLEKCPKYLVRHSSTQAAPPVKASPNRLNKAMSRWALITALEISGLGGWVRAHMVAVPET